MSDSADRRYLISLFSSMIIRKRPYHKYVNCENKGAYVQYRVSDKFTCNSDKQYREERRHRRQEKAYWLAYILISGFTLGAACYAAHYAGGAYDQAKRQADIAKRALIESERPIIVTQLEGVDLTGSSHEGKFAAIANFANYGNKPAFLSNMYAQTTIGDVDYNNRNRCLIRDGINHIVLAEKSSNNWACLASTRATDTEKSDVLSGKQTLFFVVTIFYTSARGSRWRRIDKSFYDVGLKK